MTFRVIPVPGFGAEDVVVATSGPDEGAVFTGTEDGAIHRIRHDGGSTERVAYTAGRPLGIELLPDGRLLVCDARRGVLAVDPRTGTVDTLFREVGGRPMTFCNNAAVAEDGTVYVSDSSTVHPIDRWKAEVLELTGTGRLLRRTPDGTVDVLLDGLQFANGVALSGDESFAVVAETSTRNLIRYWLSGPEAGSHERFVADLPGYPDNISRGSDGLIWVTIASPRDAFVERLQTGPLWLRRRATKVPEKLQPAPKRTVRVQAFDRDGVLVYDLPVDDAAHRTQFHMVTGVREHDGRVWMGSLHEPAVAVLEP
jgi:sugar lactone lactonase YvrE